VEEKVQTKLPRLAGFDLIRLISFAVVALYHFMYAAYRGRVPQFELTMWVDPIYSHTILPYIRSLSFSGHTLMFISMILIALARKNLTQTLRFSVFLFLAWLSFVWAEGDFRSFEPFWDIHVLLLLGLITISVADKISPRFAIALGVAGFFSTWFTYWNKPIFLALPLGVRSALVGDCESGYASWPILPWLGLLWFGYALGLLIRNPIYRERVSKISKLEWVFWVCVLIPSIPRMDTYYNLDFSMWECEAFRLPPISFWSDFIWVLFAIRLSLVTSVNDWIAAKFQFLQRLNVSKNFFLAYVLQYLLAFALVAAAGDYLRSHALVFTLTSFALLPSAELLTWLAVRAGARTLFKGR